jgi:hypothetical protein
MSLKGLPEMKPNLKQFVPEYDDSETSSRNVNTNILQVAAKTSEWE